MMREQFAATGETSSGPAGSPTGGSGAWAAYGLLVLAMLAWSGNITIGRAIHEAVPPFTLSFWRCFVMSLMLAPLLVGRWSRLAPVVGRHWRLLAVLGVLQFVGGQGLMFLGLQTTSSINAGLLNATQPAMIAMLAWAIAGERLSAVQIVGIAAAFVGVAHIVARGDPATLLGLDLVVGDLFVIAALLAWSLYAVLLRRLPRIEALTLIGLSAVPATLALLPFYAAEVALTGRHIDPSWPVLAMVGYLALVGGLVGVAAWNAGIARIGPARSSSFLYLVPVFTSAFGVALLGESLHLYHLVGVALVIGGVAVANGVRVPLPGWARARP